MAQNYVPTFCCWYALVAKRSMEARLLALRENRTIPMANKNDDAGKQILGRHVIPMQEFDEESDDDEASIPGLRCPDSDDEDEVFVDTVSETSSDAEHDQDSFDLDEFLNLPIHKSSSLTAEAQLADGLMKNIWLGALYNRILCKMKVSISWSQTYGRRPDGRLYANRRKWMSNVRSCSRSC